MTTDPSGPRTIDEYISGCRPDVRRILETIRATVKTAAPDAEEAIKYHMPTFLLHGRSVHFAAWKKHVGFYGAWPKSRLLQDQLSAYAGPKGSLKFRIDRPVPLGLISAVVKLKAGENPKGLGRKKVTVDGGSMRARG
jgi:uncharacterized protein YdhG (YjbR/CyaY superfamily)